MGRTSIEWVKSADGSEGMSWNALRARRKVGGRPGITANHCEHVNQACVHCYAESLNARLGGLPFKPGHRKDYEFFVDEKKLLEPLRRRKPTRIFVESMSDAFGEWWPTEFIDRLYLVMARTPHHTYINLSKRPERRRQYLADPETPKRVALADGAKNGSAVILSWPLPNVIEGTSVSCQSEADEFVPILLATKAALRCVSAEPLLGPIDFTSLRNSAGLGEGHPWLDALNGHVSDSDGDSCSVPKLSWIICGGESGHGARPMHPQWARDIRDQCAAAGVEFHFKQFGAWAPTDFASAVSSQGRSMAIDIDGKPPHESDPDAALAEYAARQDAYQFMACVGKKKAGRLLDGREHNGFPGAPR